MKTNRSVRFVVGILLGLTLFCIVFAGAPSHATLILDPTAFGVIAADLGAANCEPDCVYDAFGLTNDGSLNFLYKAEVGTAASPTTVYSGPFATIYNTTFLDTSSEPSGAIMSYGLADAGFAMSCGAPFLNNCYLAIKDGNQNPSYYFFDISRSWFPLENINLSDFWPNNGAISHMAIYGTTTAFRGSVPEPSSLLLLGSGIAGLAVLRARQRKTGTA